MIRVLVTGASGQLGSSIKLVSEKKKGFLFDYTDLGELNLTEKTALEEYIRSTMPDYIINCAGYTAVDKAESEPELCYQVNYEAVKNLDSIIRGSEIKLIHISTDYVFDGRSGMPYTEEDSPNPLSVYGKSKLLGETCLLNNPGALIIRTSWLYSQFGNNFVKTILKLGREKDEIKVVEDQTGCPTYAVDLATAILSIIGLSGTEGRSFKSGIYHYSNEGMTTWYDFAREIIGSAGFNCKVIPVTTSVFGAPAPRPMYSVMNKTRIRNTFGLEIPHWKDSFHECIGLLI